MKVLAKIILTLALVAPVEVHADAPPAARANCDLRFT